MKKNKDSLKNADQVSNLSIESHYGKIVITFFITLASLLAFGWLLFQLSDYFFGWKFLSNSGALGISLLVLTCALSSTIYTFIYYYRASIQNQCKMLNNFPIHDLEQDKQLNDTIIANLHNAYEEEIWEEVIKIGSVLSRPLWVTGKYSLRVEVGKLVEAAAASNDRPKQQASALIDDLGWTKFVLGDVNAAEEYITHGISIAEKCGDFYMAHKGYRHLSGIRMEYNDLSAAKNNLEKSRKFAEQISEGEKKSEALAGVDVNMALIHLKEKHWDLAIELLDNAQNIYTKLADKDREVKIYHYKGDALYAMGKINDSKDVYREGLSLAKQLSRKDCILRNYIGLGKVANMEGDLSEAKRYYSIASKLANELGRYSLSRELETNVPREHVI